MNSDNQLPVKGMERVVVTVSGYHGSERFNLIKLITLAGANYVGAMSKSITHLVCWKFEGKKYDIAQKLNIITVNHRWIEDCIKEGRRVPVSSYIQKSGYEVGPLLLEVPLTVSVSTLTKNKAISDRLDDICSGKQKNEFSSGASGDFVLEDCFLIYEQAEPSAYSSGQSRRKKVPTQFESPHGGGAGKGKILGSLIPVLCRESDSNPRPQTPWQTRLPLSQAGPSGQSRREKRKICDGNGVSTVAGRRCARRVVKNTADEVMHDPLVLDFSQEDHVNRLNNLHNYAAATSGPSGGVANDENIIKNREAPHAGIYNQSGTVNESSDAIDQIDSSNNISTSDEASLLVAQTSIDACSAENITDGSQDNKVADLPMSRELSCVICFEAFGATRGILPCGHRFCFSCIREWVHHRTSMRKQSTCPLCKASFAVIKKVEHAAATDQKIYSQTIPRDNSAQDIFIDLEQELPNFFFERMQTSEASACVVCRGREPEDLLESCASCRTRRIHLYCMDPPVDSWMCTHCKELQRLHRIHAY